MTLNHRAPNIPSRAIAVSSGHLNVGLMTSALTGGPRRAQKGAQNRRELAEKLNARGALT